MKRRGRREQVFILLFMQCVRGELTPGDIKLYFDSMDTPLSENNREEVERYYQEILPHIPEIDGIIDKYAEKWSVSRMGNAELGLLRLSVYECLYDEDIPVGVSINEAVELAKRYCAEGSAGFVNGILGRIAKDCGNESRGDAAPG